MSARGPFSPNAARISFTPRSELDALAISRTRFDCFERSEHGDVVFPKQKLRTYLSLKCLMQADVYAVKRAQGLESLLESFPSEPGNEDPIG